MIFFWSENEVLLRWKWWSHVKMMISGENDDLRFKWWSQAKMMISGENDGADWSEFGPENPTSQKSTSATRSRKDRRRKIRETRTNHWTNWEKEEKLAVTEENNQERNSPQSKGSFLTSKNSMVQEQIVHHLGLNNNFVKRSFFREENYWLLVWRMESQRSKTHWSRTSRWLMRRLKNVRK